MKYPVIALFTGDPAGIGPELVEKFLAQGDWRSQAEILLIGQKGALQAPSDLTWLEWSGWDAPAFERGQATADNGRFMLQDVGCDAMYASIFCSVFQPCPVFS